MNYTDINRLTFFRRSVSFYTRWPLQPY